MAGINMLNRNCFIALLVILVAHQSVCCAQFILIGKRENAYCFIDKNSITHVSVNNSNQLQQPNKAIVFFASIDETPEILSWHTKIDSLNDSAIIDFNEWLDSNRRRMEKIADSIGDTDQHKIARRMWLRTKYKEHEKPFADSFRMRENANFVISHKMYTETVYIIDNMLCKIPQNYTSEPLYPRDFDICKSSSWFDKEYIDFVKKYKVQKNK